MKKKPKVFFNNSELKLTRNGNIIVGPRTKGVWKVRVGGYYKTRGGWQTKVIWISTIKKITYDEYIYVIHKPKTKEECGPIIHYRSLDDKTGPYLAVSHFSVNVPPSFGMHPADIVGEWKEEEKMK